MLDEQVSPVDLWPARETCLNLYVLNFSWSIVLGNVTPHFTHEVPEAKRSGSGCTPYPPLRGGGALGECARVLSPFPPQCGGGALGVSGIQVDRCCGFPPCRTQAPPGPGGTHERKHAGM